MQTLARQGYTATQVETALRAPTGFYGCRFELLDRYLKVVGTFDTPRTGVAPTTPGTITAAKIDYDVDRKLVGAIDLKMLPDDRLRNVPFVYRIKVYFRIGPMPDGGTVEFPAGVFVWAVPERDIAPGVEEWHVSLADGLHDFDTSDPDLGGFQAAQGERQTDAIARVVNYAGYTDTSGVQATEAVFAGPRSWGLSRPKILNGITYIPGWKSEWGFYTEGTMVSVGGHDPNQTRTTTFLDIARELHAGLGYDLPWMNGVGIYQARPAVNWTKATATVTFGTGADAITVTPVHTTNDLSKFANRVRSWTEASGTSLFFIEKDANVEVPGHPLSQAKIGRYATKYITQSTADTHEKSEQQALKELLDGLSTYQKASFDTLFWPVEPFDVVGVMVAGDAEFATRQFFQSRRCSLDLFTGVMHHEANRVFTTT